MQDRNGTIWCFWGRKLYINSLSFYYALLGMFSHDGGSTWSTPARLTNMATNVDGLMPNAVQSTYNKSIWLHNRREQIGRHLRVDILQDLSRPGCDHHQNLVLDNPRVPGRARASVGQSGLVSFTVTVLNLGDSSQVVTVSV